MSICFRLAFAAALAGGPVACSKPKAKPLGYASAASDAPARPATDRPTAASGTATMTPVGPGTERAPDFGAIYFDFDSTTLSTDARAVLERLGTWLLAHPSRLVIEGHADDRGTTEYNIALGQRRAQVIAEYLARLGVDPATLDTISYGEERPAVDGEGDSAWAQNRRGEVRPR